MAETLLDKLITWHHHLHAHPERSQKEHTTLAFVPEKRTGLGIPITPGVGGCGIVARLRRDGSDRSVGLRTAGRHRRAANARDRHTALCLDHARRDACLRP